MKNSLDHNKILRYLVSCGFTDMVAPVYVNGFVRLCDFMRDNGESEGNGMYSVDLSVNDIAVELDMPRERASRLLSYAVKTGLVSRASVDGKATSLHKTTVDLSNFGKENV